jgi:hypothetical protein
MGNGSWYYCMPCPWQRKLEASWAGCLGAVNFDQVVQWLIKGFEGVGVRGEGVIGHGRRSRAEAELRSLCHRVADYNWTGLFHLNALSVSLWIEP